MAIRTRVCYIFQIALIIVFGLVPFENVIAKPKLQQGIISPSQLIDAVNGLRLSYGLQPLIVHPILIQSSQSQADYMAATGQVTHERPSGLSFTQQLLALGFPLSGDLSLGGFRAENILMSSEPLVWNGVPPGWQDALHMNTMLSQNFTHIGAGISQGADGYYYAVDCAAVTGSGQMQEVASSILTEPAWCGDSRRELAWYQSVHGSSRVEHCPSGWRCLPQSSVWTITVEHRH